MEGWRLYNVAARRETVEMTDEETNAFNVASADPFDRFLKRLRIENDLSTQETYEMGHLLLVGLFPALFWLSIALSWGQPKGAAGVAENACFFLAVGAGAVWGIGYFKKHDAPTVHEGTLAPAPERLWFVLSALMLVCTVPCYIVQHWSWPNAFLSLIGFLCYTAAGLVTAQARYRAHREHIRPLRQDNIRIKKLTAVWRRHTVRLFLKIYAGFLLATTLLYYGFLFLLCHCHGHSC